MCGRGKEFLKATALAIVGLVLCSSTFLLGAIPLLALRSYFGRRQFFLVTAALSTGVVLSGHYFMAALYLSQILLVAIYSELDLQGIGYVISSLLSLLVVSGLSAVGAGLYVHISNLNMVAILQEKAQRVLESVRKINPSMGLDVDYLVAQVPSAIVVSFVVSLALAIIFQRNVATAVGVRPERKPSYDGLLSFELPDICVWITLIGIAGAGLNFNSPVIKTIGINILNVMVTLYFFQGLAIAFSFFKTFRIGTVWQYIWAFFMIFQLFLFVAIIGFVDYWLEIRKRLYRKVAPTKLDKRI